MVRTPLLLAVIAVAAWSCSAALAAEPLKVGMFAVDASPPVGSPLAYDPTKEVEVPLSCRGVVLLGGEQPVVVCSLDWIGVANDGQTEFRDALAAAAGTTRQRVAVHAVHQHDAPDCDFAVDELLKEFSVPANKYDAKFARDVIRRAAEAVRVAVREAQPVTHLGLGQAAVENVASNRRVLGPDGKVKYIRWSATKDPVAREQPVGTIDPLLRMITLWHGDKPLVAITYYATHPQSYYRTGRANPDFPGYARNQRQQATGVPHIHFNGAGGNVTAGKFNDGSPANRQILADRVAAGMAAAWQATQKTPIAASDLGWRSEPVLLPVAPHLDEKRLAAVVANKDAAPEARYTAARELVWVRRCLAKDPLDVSCLRLGKARVLHLPGELFVEYQLAAQQFRPDLFVCTAAYGEYAPGYIGTEISYTQGGYETSRGASLVAPNVEAILTAAIRKVLGGPASK